MVDRAELRGEHVVLTPMERADGAELLAAASEDRRTYAFTWVPHDDASMREYVDDALAEERANDGLPYTIRLRENGRAVGTSRYLDLDFWDDDGDPNVPSVVEIGSTWLAASVQGTSVNPETKLLMLSHAFDTWRVHRVTFKTDARNEQSRRAIARLGAQFEGIRRAHRIGSDGAIRDSAYFSIVRAEWPAVRDGLLARLSGGVTTPTR
jgi:N-acetyltransferase